MHAAAPDLFRDADAAHRRGQLAEAERLYRQVLVAAPDRADALHGLGMAALQRADAARGVDLIQRAVAAAPGNAVYLGNLGIGLAMLNRFDEAFASYDSAIALQPESAAAHRNRAILALRLGRSHTALESLDRIATIEPTDAAVHRRRGEILHALGRPDEARAAFQTTIALTPDDAEAHNSLGVVLGRQRRHQDALVCFERATALRPAYAEAWSNRGKILCDLGRHKDALASCDTAIALMPDFAAAHKNRGNSLLALSRFSDALASFDSVTALTPGDAEAHHGRGIALADLDRHEEALRAFDASIGLNPRIPEAHINRANILWCFLDRCEDAIAAYDTALAVDPDIADAHVNKGICCLSLGRFQKGWPLYEWRGTFLPSRPPPGQLWLGRQDIAGRTVFLWAEQGMGDTLQFCRYAGLLKARGAQVVLSVQQPLVRLLARIDSSILVLGPDQRPAVYDSHCPLMSLPLAFGTALDTIPAGVPYLTADEMEVAAWRARFARMPGKKIGLVWAGGPRPEHPKAHAVDRRRSIALAHYAPFARVPGCHWISLQKGEAAAQARTPPQGMVLHDWTEELADFAATAALVMALDLVITVDTAVAHLAGALGKPVWILNRYDQCWRWLRGRTDSPWYPSARLFRQATPGCWDRTIHEAARALAAEARAD